MFFLNRRRYLQKVTKEEKKPKTPPPPHPDEQDLTQFLMAKRENNPVGKEWEKKLAKRELGKKKFKTVVRKTMALQKITQLENLKKQGNPPDITILSNSFTLRRRTSRSSSIGSSLGGQFNSTFTAAELRGMNEELRHEYFQERENRETILEEKMREAEEKEIKRIEVINNYKKELRQKYLQEIGHTDKKDEKQKCKKKVIGWTELNKNKHEEIVDKSDSIFGETNLFFSQIFEPSELARIRDSNPTDVKTNHEFDRSLVLGNKSKENIFSQSTPIFPSKSNLGNEETLQKGNLTDDLPPLRQSSADAFARRIHNDNAKKLNMSADSVLLRKSSSGESSNLNSSKNIPQLNFNGVGTSLDSINSNKDSSNQDYNKINKTTIEAEINVVHSPTKLLNPNEVATNTPKSPLPRGARPISSARSSNNTLFAGSRNSSIVPINKLRLGSSRSHQSDSTEKEGQILKISNSETELYNPNNTTPRHAKISLPPKLSPHPSPKKAFGASPMPSPRKLSQSKTPTRRNSRSDRSPSHRINNYANNIKSDNFLKPTLRQISDPSNKSLSPRASPRKSFVSQLSPRVNNKVAPNSDNSKSSKKNLSVNELKIPGLSPRSPIKVKSLNSPRIEDKSVERREKMKERRKDFEEKRKQQVEEQQKTKFQNTPRREPKKRQSRKNSEELKMGDFLGWDNNGANQSLEKILQNELLRG